MNSKTSNRNIHILTESSEHWPALFSAIKSPPVLLYAKGDLSALQAAYKVAVIGTRTPTEHGAKVASRLGQIFAEEGLCVVSGLLML